jgi:PPOX class probable F420-dependent enzyme
VTDPIGSISPERLRRAKHLYVTTWSRAGKPGTVPVWFMAKDGGLYFTTMRSSVKARRIKANGKVRVSIGAPDGPTFDGRAEWVEDRPDLVRDLLRAYRRKYPLLVPLFMGPLLRRRLRKKRSVIIAVRPDAPEAARSSVQG